MRSCILCRPQVVTSADGLEQPLVPGGGDRVVAWSQLGKYVRRVKQVRVSEMQKQCEVRVQGTGIQALGLAVMFWFTACISAAGDGKRCRIASATGTRPLRCPLTCPPAMPNAYAHTLVPGFTEPFHLEATRAGSLKSIISHATTTKYIQYIQDFTREGPNTNAMLCTGGVWPEASRFRTAQGKHCLQKRPRCRTG